MSGVLLVGGRECKLITGQDDHSRFMVIAKVMARPTGRSVCDAVAEAAERYGMPSKYHSVHVSLDGAASNLTVQTGRTTPTDCC